MEAGGWPPLSINEGRGTTPYSYPSPCCLLFFLPPLLHRLAEVFIVPRRGFSAEEKGNAPKEGSGSPPPKRGCGPHRKYVATPRWPLEGAVTPLQGPASP